MPLVAFLVLSGGVAANVFFLQTSPRASGQAFDAAAWNIAAIEAADVGDTGSLGQTASDRVAANGLNLATVSEGTPSTAGDPAEVTRAIQRELQIRGYETGARNGVVGTMTRGAIMAFEHDHGLPLTARPSDALLKAIVLGEGSASPAASRSKGESREAQAVTRDVQRALAKLGYKPGPASGKLTPETARAIRAFEADQAMAESGRISGPLIARLVRLSGAGRVAAAP